jgi:UDP-glucose 4-epimerase
MTLAPDSVSTPAPTLVIGCGFIGSNVVAALLAAGAAPRVLTRSRPPAPLDEAIGTDGLILGDAADRATVEAALKGVEHVAFCAGGLLPRDSERDPERDRVLTLGPLRTTLEALRARPGVRLTYLSSGGTVYGEPQRVPVGEDDPTEPTSVYGRLHLECEREIEAARREHGLRARTLRCSTVYGAHQRPDRGQGAIVTFLHRIERELPIELFGGESTIRDYVYVGDVARTVLSSGAREDGPDLLNVGSGEGTSLSEVLRLAEAEVGRRAIVHEYGERDFDVHRIVLDIGRLRGWDGFEPTPLATGVASTHAWLKELEGDG